MLFLFARPLLRGHVCVVERGVWLSRSRSLSFSRAAVLVKFDKPLRGPRDEAFRDLAITIGDRGSGVRFLLADVNVQGSLAGCLAFCCPAFAAPLYKPTSTVLLICLFLPIPPSCLIDWHRSGSASSDFLFSFITGT